MMTIIKYDYLTEDQERSIVTSENVYEVIRNKKGEKIIKKLPLRRSPYLIKPKKGTSNNYVVDVYDVEPSKLEKLKLTSLVQEIEADDIIGVTKESINEEKKELYYCFDFIPYKYDIIDEDGNIKTVTLNEKNLSRRLKRYLRPVVMLDKRDDGTVKITPSPYVKPSNLIVDGRTCYYPLVDKYIPSLFEDFPIVRLVEIDDKLISEDYLLYYLKNREEMKQEIPVKKMLSVIKYDSLTNDQESKIVTSENVYKVGYRKGKKVIQRLPLRKSPYLVKPKPYDSWNYVVDVSSVDLGVLEELNLTDLVKEIDADEIIGYSYQNPIDKSKEEKTLFNFFEFVPYKFDIINEHGEIETITLKGRIIPEHIRSYLNPIVMIDTNDDGTIKITPSPYVKHSNLTVDGNICYYPLKDTYDSNSELFNYIPIKRAIEIDGQLVFEENLDYYLSHKEQKKGRQKILTPQKKR